MLVHLFSGMQVGDLRLTNKKLLANILTAIRGISEQLPGGFGNIRSVSIKAAGAPNILVYISWSKCNCIFSCG